MGLPDDHLPVGVNQLPYVIHNGVRRVLACLPPVAKCGLPKFSDKNAGLTKAQWQEIDLSHFVFSIFDQGQTSSCVGQGTTKGIEVCINQTQSEKIGLNPYFTYGLVNGGHDKGAVISQALQALKKYGTCSQDAAPMHLLFPNQLSQVEYANAIKHKIVEAYQCVTFDDICAALSKGFPVPFGIYVGNNFDQVDRDLICPLPDGGGGGHCMLALGLKNHPRWGWIIKLVNSWGITFGDKGFAYIRQAHFDRRVDAFAIEAITPDSNNEPPIAKATNEPIKPKGELAPTKLGEKKKHKENRNG
jgi:hypothetical protein